MKKFFLYFLLSIFCFNALACLIDSSGAQKLILRHVTIRFTGWGSSQVQAATNNLTNNATTLSTNTNLSNAAINSISTGLAQQAPQQVLLNSASMQNTTNAIVTAANNASAVGFDNLSVTNVSGSGTDGVSLTMQQTNDSGGTYTVQVNTSSTTPQNVTTATSATQSTNNTRNSVNTIYNTNRTVSTATSTATNSSGLTVRSYSVSNISNNNNSVSSNTTDLLTGQASNGTSNTTGGSTIISQQIINQNGQSTIIGGNVPINQNTTTTYSANPTITNQSTVTFNLSDGTTRRFTVSTGQMQVVQKTTTVITRSNGSIVFFETTGQPVVNMNLSTENVRRVTVNGQVLQGRNIDIWDRASPDSPYTIVIDGQRFDYPADTTVSGVTNHNVYTMNGIPSVYQVQQGDQTGSTNSCTYYVNGLDTGVVANMASMTTVVLHSDNSTITGNQITTRQVNGQIYYVVDGVLTSNVYNSEDRVSVTYRPIDSVAMNTRNVQTITNVIVKNANGETLLTSDNLGQQVVQTVRLSNGSTLRGTIGKTNATKITYNGNTYVGIAVTSQNGTLYLDGQNTNIPVNGQITSQSVQIYVVDGRTTNNIVNSSDIQTSTTYYTNNGQLTNIVVDPTHQIESNTTSNRSSNVTSEQMYTIRTNDNRTYTTNNINQVNNGTVIRDSNGDIVISGNNIGTVQRSVLYSTNGTRLGLNENATYQQEEHRQQGKIISATVNNFYDTNITFQNNYYVPKYNGSYFVVDGKLIQNNLNGSTIQVNSRKQDYVAVEQPVYVDRNTTGRWSLIDSEIVTSFGSFYFETYSNYKDVLLLPTCFGTKTKAHCISCGNNLKSGRTDAAGSMYWNDLGVSIVNGQLYNFNNISIDSNTDWKQVQMIDSRYFVAMKKYGNLYLVYMTDFQRGSVTDLEIPIRFDTIASYCKGSKQIYGISGNKLYRININPTTQSISYQDLGINNINKIVAGRTICVALDSTNHRVYVIDNQNNYNTYNSTSNFNIRDIGVSRNEALIVGYQTINNNASVTINGVTYNPNQVETRTQTVYTVNNRATDIIYEQSHVRTQNQITYNFVDSATNQNISLSKNSQVESVDYRCVTRTQSGSVASIVTTATNGQGQQTYLINGNDTNVPFSIGTPINNESRSVYYIGDTRTDVLVSDNDNIQLRDGYWTINGQNTNVRFYGLGQMVVQVSDVTPGQLDEQQNATASQVVVPLKIRAQIIRFNPSRPITSIRLQYKKLTDSQWTNLKVLTNQNRKLQTRRLEAIFGRYVNVPVNKQQSFILRCNISDGETSTVTASSLQPQQGNIFYWSFIRSNYDRSE